MKNKKVICKEKNLDIMFCENCKSEKDEKDFILSQPFCFQCMFKLKIQNRIEKPKSKKFCRICKKELIFIEKSKEKQRTIYCSIDCAVKGQKKLTINYWTTKMRNYFS